MKWTRFNHEYWAEGANGVSYHVGLFGRTNSRFCAYLQRTETDPGTPLGFGFSSAAEAMEACAKREAREARWRAEKWST